PAANRTAAMRDFDISSIVTLEGVPRQRGRESSFEPRAASFELRASQNDYAPLLGEENPVTRTAFEGVGVLRLRGVRCARPAALRMTRKSHTLSESHTLSG